MGILLADEEFAGLGDKRVVDITMRGKPKSDPVLDGWLNHHLSRLYGPVLEEPIPDTMLKLLEERLG